MTAISRKGKILSNFRSAGNHLLVLGLNTSHSGNLSVREGDVIYITRTGAMLDNLGEEDIIELNVSKVQHPEASLEYPVHREIYLSTPAGAVIHCHPPYAIALSFRNTEILPADLEGRHHLDRIPVVEHGGHMHEKVSRMFEQGNRVVLIRGHGAFSAGQTVEEALHYASALEMSAKIICFSSLTEHCRS